MAPKLSEDEIDDLVYLARTGDDAELTGMLQELVARENATPAEILAAAKDDGKATCLHMAAANGHAKTVTLLLSHFPPPPKTPAGGAAAAAGTPETTEDTPPRDATAETPYINVQNTFGNTALHWACLGGHLDVVKLLLSRGASPTAANDKDQIPLDLAAFNNHMHVVNYFLSQSKDIEGDNAKEGGLEKSTQDVQMDDDASEEAGTKAEAGG
ncbi:ankyrin [Hypoxylon sp. FL1150]|nr:ankyrin [Hypoxylon sp. FL1150]